MLRSNVVKIAVVKTENNSGLKPFRTLVFPYKAAMKADDRSIIIHCAPVKQPGRPVTYKQYYRRAW